MKVTESPSFCSIKSDWANINMENRLHKFIYTFLLEPYDFKMTSLPNSEQNIHNHSQLSTPLMCFEL